MELIWFQHAQKWKHYINILTLHKIQLQIDQGLEDKI